MSTLVEQDSMRALEAIADDQLLLRREILLARRREILDEIAAAQSQIEAEITARIERNGGRAILAHQEGLILTAELVDQYTPWTYNVAGLRDLAGQLPEKEAAKIVKHVEEQVTVIAAHDEPGNPRSIQALIDRYGEGSAIGQLLSECRQRGKVGTKLSISAEGTR